MEMFNKNHFLLFLCVGLSLTLISCSNNYKEEFPINPNGSTYNIAAISNKEGNVMSIMPHPERANWLRQVPNSRSKDNNQGPGRKIFLAMKEYIEGN